VYKKDGSLNFKQELQCW